MQMLQDLFRVYCIAGTDARLNQFGDYGLQWFFPEGPRGATRISEITPVGNIFLLPLQSLSNATRVSSPAIQRCWSGGGDSRWEGCLPLHSGRGKWPGKILNPC